MSTFNKYNTKGAYHFGWYETEPWYRDCVDECVKFCKGKTVDVGCGDGLLLSKLPEGSFGLDNDPIGLELATGKELDVTKIDLDDPRTDVSIFGKYDYVACLNTIEHLNDLTTLLSLVRNARRGAIILTLEWQGGAFGEDHKTEYTLPELIHVFKGLSPKPFRIKDFPEWIGVKI